MRNSRRRFGRIGATLLEAAGLLVLTVRPAEARLVDLHVAGQVGALGGWGSSSRPDFFDHTHGGTVGAEAGLKLLVFDLSGSFTQVLNSSGASGTLTQLVLSIDVDIPLGRRRLSTGQTVQIIHPSVGGGVAFGTPGPVNPPLDAAQISDKGLVVPARVGYEYFLNPFIAVGRKECSATTISSSAAPPTITRRGSSSRAWPPSNSTWGFDGGRRPAA